MARQAAINVEELLRTMRRWKKTKPLRKTTKYDFRFTVMTYNILSQNAMENHMFLYRNCNPMFLPEEYRISKIIPEILNSQSDIICLQEVEQRVYDNRIKKVFDSNGFASVFKKRTGCKSDGCAILWRKRKFSLVGHRDIEFASKGNSLLDRDNIGLIAVLKPNHPNSRNTLLHVATTHLLFNPRRGDIKFCQIRWLLAELERMSLRHIVDGHRHYHPVVLCGDFNIEPFSPLYNFVETGCMNVGEAKSGDLSGQLEGRKKGKLLESQELVLYKLGISDATRFEELPSMSDSDQIRDQTDVRLSPQVEMEPGSVQYTGIHKDPSLGSSTDQRLTQSLLPNRTQQTGFVNPELMSNKSPKEKSEEAEHLFYHDFKFVPAYKYHNMSRKDIPITSLTGNDSNNVDHIFYNVREKTDCTTFKEGRLKLHSIYTLLFAKDAKELGGLPNAVLGSDHICLMARFALTFNRFR